MSLNSKRTPAAVRERAGYDVKEELFLEGLDDGFYPLPLPDDTDRLTLDDVTTIVSVLSSDIAPEAIERALYAFLSERPSLSYGGRWMARRIFSKYSRLDGLSVGEVLADAARELAAYRAIEGEVLARWDSLPHKDRYPTPFAWSMSLLDLCDRPRETGRFLDLYIDLHVRGRSPLSCFQISRRGAFAVANRREFAPLPLWMKRALVSRFAVTLPPKPSPSELREIVAGLRVGDTRRLFHRCRAWAVQPGLPPKIADRVGPMPYWKRLTACRAWIETGDKFYLENGRPVPAGGAERDNRFWRLFNSYTGGMDENPAAYIETILSLHSTGRRARNLLSPLLGVPAATVTPVLLGVTTRVSGSRAVTLYRMAPRTAFLNATYGVSSPSVNRVFDAATDDAILWARDLAPRGNPDAIVAFLSADTIRYEPSAVAFLKSLGWRSALRMLKKTTYRRRGVDRPVEGYLVRDTGHLYSNTIAAGVKPELGRVRCWYSVHETIARVYVRTLPDRPLPVRPGWEEIDGLSAVDRGWSISVPRDTRDLKLWGELLHNCVGGYGEQIARGITDVFAVLDRSGSPLYCVEVRERRITQFSGQHNDTESVDPSVRSDIAAALVSAGLIEKGGV